MQGVNSSMRYIAENGERHRHKSCTYKDYITPEAADIGVREGELFESRIRFNAADIRQAFCTIHGLPNDVFIRGAVSQNRAIDGDCVVVRILPNITKMSRKLPEIICFLYLSCNFPPDL